MKKILLLSAFIFLSSCSISGDIADNVTEVRSATTQGTGMTEPYEIGTVDTAFQLIGPDHKIEVGGVPDPKVSGITCFYSRAKTGGIA